MPTPDLEALWHQATAALSRGNTAGAVEMLKRILAAEPDFAEAHALLALCLVDMRRLGAAEVEAGLALKLDAESFLSHRAMAQVRFAQRRFSDAEEHFRVLLESEPDDASLHRDLGRLHAALGRRQEADASMRQALSLEPDDPDNLVALGDLRLSRGQLDEAERLAQEALSLSPRHQDALVLMGSVALRRGDIPKAREHALWALAIDASDRDALRLMASLKARESWYLGLWWRYSAWAGELGGRSVILVLLLAYTAYRVLRQVLLDFDNTAAAEIVSYAWLGVCVYTWVGPGLFQRELKKELSTVALRKDF